MADREGEADPSRGIAKAIGLVVSLRTADCTAVVQLQPGPGILIEERMVIGDGAEQILSGTIAPGPVMVTAVQKRID